MTGLGILRSIQQWTFERRLHGREFVDGSVLIKRESDNNLLTASLLDRSTSGCRIAYSGGLLQPGEGLLVMAPFADFNAQVVWCRQTGDRVEAGLKLWPASRLTRH